MYLSRTMAKRADKSLQIPESRNIRQNSARIWRIRRVLANHAVLICVLEPPRLTKRMSNMVRRDNLIGLVALSAVFALTGFGSACSGGEPQTGAPDPTVSAMLEGVEVDKSLRPTVEGVTVVQGLDRSGPVSGGVLAAPMTVCPPPDPAIDAASEWHDLGSPPLVTEIHAGLTRIVDDPVAPFELELAESYNVDSTGLEYEFVLRNDLKFSDGSPLTSGDFKWSWERALKKSEAGSRARDVLGLVDGAQEIVLGDSEELHGVVAIDDRTLKVRLTNPRADFPALLADPVASVLKRENAESWPIEWYNSGMVIGGGRFNQESLPVGAGPFKLIDHWDQSEPNRCAIARNPHYWGEPAYLDGVWYRPDTTEMERHEEGGWVVIGTDPLAFVEESTDFEELANRYIVEDLDNIAESEPTVEPIEGIEVEGAEQNVAIFPSTYVFAVLNAAAPPFDDVHFGRAAASYSQLTTYIGNIDHNARLITEELTTLEPTAEFVRYDEEVAKSALAASKYADHDDSWKAVVLYSHGFRKVFADHPSFVEWAEALNLDLEEDDFGVPVLDDFDGRHNNKFHIRIYSVPPAYPDPVTILRSLTAPFGKLNRAPEFVTLDAMLAEAATERDSVKRHELYLEIEQYVAEQALVIPIAILPTAIHYRTHPWVHDLNPPKYPGSIFHKVWLDDTAPKRELPKP